jgi:hypothetical protein
MVLKSAFSACRESSLACCTWCTNDDGMSLVITPEKAVSGAIGSGFSKFVKSQVTAAPGYDIQPIGVREARNTG